MQKNGYIWIDRFRIVAAFLIVAVHVSPFLSFNETIDFIFTRVIARIGVPFFFMVSAFFVFRKYLETKNMRILITFLKKMLLLYGIAIAIYLPINIYTGQLEGTSFLRILFFDGTFYHLWYFPAVIMGSIIIAILLKYFSLKMGLIIVIFLYLIGLGGDSYYRVLLQLPFFHALYDFLFSLFSYTRNGIFMAPLFLYLGVILSQKKEFALKKNVTWSALFFLFMLFEALCLHYFGVQRHDSMYLFLPFLMYFLFQALASKKGKREDFWSFLSLVIYLIHPFIVAVLHTLTNKVSFLQFYQSSSFGQYLTVSILSIMIAFFFLIVKKKLDKKCFFVKNS